MRNIAYSSELYLLKTTELQQLEAGLQTDIPQSYNQEVIVLLSEKGDKIINGYDEVLKSSEPFVAVRLAYESYPQVLGVLLNLIKPIKRRFYKIYPNTYTTTLTCLLNNDITRGERNAQNAYEWHNKKWKITREEAHKRYNDLYASIKAHGYNAKTPMLIMLNRKLGVKDQLLQGHHRIGICKELNVQEVAVSFWSAPKSADFFKIFIRRKK